MKFRFRLPWRLRCVVCKDSGYLLAYRVFEREQECTCGAGAVDEWTFHDWYCDTVPCPFCTVLGKPPARVKERA